MSILFSNSLQNAQIRQHISEFLQPDEAILWLGMPANGSTFSPLLVGLAVLLTIAGTSLYAGLWLTLPTTIFEQFPLLISLVNQPVFPASFMTCIGLFIGVTAWYRRPSKWIYAISNNRLLVIFGNKLLREKTPRQLKYVKITNRQGDRGDIYWEIRSGKHRSTYDDDGKPLNRGSDGRYVGFKGQNKAEKLCSEILKWQKQAIESELKVSTASAEAYLSSVKPVDAIKSTQADSNGAASHRLTSNGSQTIHNHQQGYSVDVPTGWVTQVSQRKKGVLPFLKISFLDNIYRDGTFKPYAENINWNLLSTQGTAESWLEIYSSPGSLSTNWETIINDPWAARLNQKVINQEPNLIIGKFKGFSITRSMSSGVTIANYGTTKTEVHIQMTWLSDGKLAFEFRAIVPAHSTTLQQTVATIPTTLRILEK